MVELRDREPTDMMCDGKDAEAFVAWTRSPF